MHCNPYENGSDSGGYLPVKILSDMEINETLILCGRVYSLLAVVFHAGDAPNRGHYFTVARHGPIADGMFFLYDDLASRRRVACPTRIRDSSDATARVMLMKLQMYFCIPCSLWNRRTL